MITLDRYLHFDNIDVEQPEISSQCSRCGHTFEAEPRPGSSVDDVLLRSAVSSIRTNASRRWSRLHRDRILATPTSRESGNGRGCLQLPDQTI